MWCIYADVCSLVDKKSICAINMRENIIMQDIFIREEIVALCVCSNDSRELCVLQAFVYDAVKIFI